jgi:hypothetical protein
MSERQESLIREQTILLWNRNLEKQYMFKKIIKRYLRCLLK